ncbi:hypothetical protein GDO81_027986 [Engystomops pustulosus]|uniref:Uncharacterized protein n=1 Tax=Engystomops pustulosus TaxID=76066 RepID=A0AAV6Z6J9_ENGPU|nr:hypothetical protein GDO81_027986 [Engystomops pustulosus]
MLKDIGAHLLRVRITHFCWVTRRFPICAELPPGFWRKRSDFGASAPTFTQQKLGGVATGQPTDSEKPWKLKTILCRKISTYMHREEEGELRRTSAQQ